MEIFDTSSGHNDASIYVFNVILEYVKLEYYSINRYV